MICQYNPHQHVKIWLSKDPSVFMNFENKMRLIEMRIKNPNDAISFVYDSSLLNSAAKVELIAFCEAHNFKPVDAASFAQNSMTDNEQRLYHFFKDEINHLDEGGNLAVASDILRWISPVYKHGTYTDFDVPVNTSNLPATIEVASPLLLNIGSLKLGRNELVLSNNDYIAIVDRHAGKSQIEKVQVGILNVLEEYESDFIENASNALGGDSFLKSLIRDQMKARGESEYIEKSNGIQKPNGKKFSSRELRQYIHGQTKDRPSFITFHRNDSETDGEVIARLRRNLASQLSIIKWFFFNKDYQDIQETLAKDDDEFLKDLMKKERSLYIKSIVVCTTGPIEIAKALFDGQYVLNGREFESLAAPMSFNFYGLKSAFQSLNSIPMHLSPIGMLNFLGTEDGELNDSSWLEEGINLQHSRQKILLKKRENLEQQLPGKMGALKEQINGNITRIQKESSGLYSWLTFFRQSARTEKMKLLQAVLACFNDEAQEFSIKDFRGIADSIQNGQKDVFAGFFLSQTQTLIENLEQICTEAQRFQVAKEGQSINYASSPASA